MDPLPALLTASDVGNWLCVPPSKVRAMARKGLIPSYSLPSGDLVFDRAELTAWIKVQKKQSREMGKTNAS
jgi:hypothetical protein